MTESQRIKLAIKTLTSLGVAKNQEDIGKMLGYSHKSSFSQVLNGKVNLPADFIDRLCNLSTMLNKDWVKTGNGNVLYANNTNLAQNQNKEESDVNLGNLKNSGLSLISAEKMIEYNAGHNPDTDKNTPKFLIPTFEGADYLITIIGNSMYPKYNNGDIVACKHLSLATFFQWNKVYVINTAQGILVKRICKSNDDNFVTIVSDNKDYDAFELPKSEMLSVAIVTGTIRLE